MTVETLFRDGGSSRHPFLHALPAQLAQVGELERGPSCCLAGTGGRKQSPHGPTALQKLWGMGHCTIPVSLYSLGGAGKYKQSRRSPALSLKPVHAYAETRPSLAALRKPAGVCNQAFSCCPAEDGESACPLHSATGETVISRLPPSGHCTNSRLKHTPVFL